MKPLAALIALALAASPTFAADAGHGQKLARQHCARCHVMPGMSNFGIGSTPSFKIMVTASFPDWRERFERFYVLPPHGNFARIRELPLIQPNPPIVAPFELTLKDLDDLMAYVDRLASELRNKP